MATENVLVKAEPTGKASWWSITINNPTEADYDALEQENWPSFVKRVKYQTEQGAEGTIHVQGAVNTTQVRFSAVKKWLPRAHIEAAKDKAALLKYVEKKDTQVSTLPSGDIQKAPGEFMTMEKCLVAFVKYYNIVKAKKCYDIHDDSNWILLHKTAEQIETDMYWDAVNLYLRDRPELISVLSNPQMMRAWLHTRPVWAHFAKCADEARTKNDLDNVDD